MHVRTLLVTFMGLAAAVEAVETSYRSPIAMALERRQKRNGQGKDGNGSGNGGESQERDKGGNNGGRRGGPTLDANLIQTASQQDGNNPGADGQSASATDNDNFINFCRGKTLTNGKQIKQGSCNGIPMGNIPATNKMVSSVFVNPQNGANLPANKDFKIQVQMINFSPGTFTNATSTYYSAPQNLDAQGNIIGHTHVTVQDTGTSLNPTQALDPTKFAFFKGINNAGNGQGLLSADVTGGLPAGNYRLCSMSAAANHQPVLMPVAQRGAQDDCVRFTVSGGNGDNNKGGRREGQQDGQQEAQPSNQTSAQTNIQTGIRTGNQTGTRIRGRQGGPRHV